MYRRQCLFVLIASALVSILAFKLKDNAQVETGVPISRQQVYKNKLVVQCSPDWSMVNTDSLANSITILPGWGNYQWEISSPSDSARVYFQQGINMYYSFHILEAIASFKKAQLFDDKNPMIYWSLALAYGPNINDVAETFTPEAYTVAQKAFSLSANCTPKEKALIKAMSVRYSPDTLTSRAVLNKRYTEEMKKNFIEFKSDADIGALYADAMMVEHPWMYWKHDGTPEAWTPLIVEVLEKTLRISENHPGANHYYIHAVEASPDPKRALPSANRLSGLLPAVSHMVHMPSHIFIRSGLYQQGMKVNQMSVDGYNKYLALFPEVQNNAPLYLFHNLHMQAACASFAADYEAGAKIAKDCSTSFDTSYLSLPAPWASYIQYVYMTPTFTDVRFGKWETILNTPQLPSNYVFANVLQHWAKGMAYARQKKFDKASSELQSLKDKMHTGDLDMVMQPFNAPSDAAAIAEKLLEGIIAEEKGDLTSATASLREAIVRADKLIYNEPRDWILPVRPYLGAVLLKAGAAANAEKIFREDLAENPDNHWGLKGLHESLMKQHKDRDAAQVQKQLKRARSFGGIPDLPSVY